MEIIGIGIMISQLQRVIVHQLLPLQLLKTICYLIIYVVVTYQPYNHRQYGLNYHLRYNNPLGPWYGLWIDFKGKQDRGDQVVFDYQIECDVPCKIVDITIEGYALAPF